MKRPCQIIASIALLCLINTGCSVMRHRLESDVRSGAVLYAESLKANGALPGFAPDEPGEIILDDAVAVFMHTGVEYPLELILRSRKRNDPEKAEYVYRLMKDAPDVEWKLIGTCKRVGGKNIWYMDMQEENPQPSTEGDGLKPAP